MIAIYLLLFAIILSVICLTAPHFSYTLDDPYIHLALAQNIIHGHYGINTGETTSPSSSVFWPFLLAPLSHSAISGWTPLLFNFLFSIATCLLVGNFLGPKLEPYRLGTFKSCLLAFLVVLSANLIGLTFVGMEHVLQLLLVVGCAIAILLSFYDQRVPWILLLCAILAPGVRYEDILFTAAVAGALWLQGRGRAALLVFSLSLIPCALLGLFLHAHGLPFLPNSVIMKGGIMTARPHLFPHHLLLDHVLAVGFVSTSAYLTQSERYPIVFLVLALGAILWIKLNTSPRVIRVAPALVAALLFIAFGPYGWFYRYDAALRFFLFFLVVALILDFAISGRKTSWLCSLLACPTGLLAAIQTPFASQQFARQQYFMQRFSHDFEPTNLAVNDLGWVSFNADGRFYILDLMGLASNEVLNTRIKDAAWLSSIVERHHVNLVMIYPSAVLSIPTSWTRIAVLHKAPHKVHTMEVRDEVSFYAVHPQDVTGMTAQVSRFALTLPPGVWITPEPVLVTKPLDASLHRPSAPASPSTAYNAASSTDAHAPASPGSL